MKKAIFITILLLTGISRAAEFPAKVTSIADGDTITVKAATESFKIRLYGIDAPEGDQPFSAKAKSLMNVLCRGKVVQVKTIEKDRYGRWVAQVILPPTRSVNQEMVRQGLAWHYKKYSKNPLLAQLEDQARKEKKGLWSDPNPIAPWDWREGVRPPGFATATPTPIRIEMDGSQFSNGSALQANSPPQTMPVIGNRNSKIYHPQGCKHISRMNPNNMVTFPSAEAAEAAGYRHCR